MNRTVTLISFITILFFSSCNYNVYYVSPFNINCNTYYARPLVSDSIRSAIYGTTLISTGSQNYGRDNPLSVQLSLHRSHTFRYLQAYYGANLAVGTYLLGENNYLVNRNYDGRYFGGGWANGGINLVIPVKQHEFRVLGIESSFGKEWGDYLQFRNHLPDSVANIIYRNNRFGSIGLSTEMVFKARNGAIGMKFAYGESFYRNIDKERSLARSKSVYLPPGYYSTTFSYTKQKYTLSIQLNADEHATSGQLGFTYKLNSILR